MKRWMAIALEEARKAKEEGEVPVGAVVVLEGVEISRAHNKTISLADPTAHAEILALRQAAEKIGNYRLTGADIFVTKEPCLMCAGAMIHARISRLIYGARDEKAGAFSKFKVDLSLSNHVFEIVEGIMAQEAAEILREFFRERR